ncbi:hypothetical protein [Streptomyces sp. NPDC052107]
MGDVFEQIVEVRGEEAGPLAERAVDQWVTEGPIPGSCPVTGCAA